MAFNGVGKAITVLDNNGDPVSGAQIKFEKYGTSTDQAAFLDEDLTTPAANPMIADTGGRAEFYLNPLLSYTVTEKGASGAPTYRSINYAGGAGGAGSNDIFIVVDTYTELAALSGEDSEDVVLVLSDNRWWQWVSGDQSSSVTADPAAIDYVPPAAAPTGASGVWAALDEWQPILREQASAAANVQGFTKKIADDKNFFLVPNIYEIGSAITIDQDALSIACSFASNVYGGDGQQAVIRQTADDTPHFIITAANTSLRGLYFDTTGDGADYYIEAELASGGADVELAITDCYFFGNNSDTKALIRINGRGLHLHNIWFVGGTAPLCEIDFSGLSEGDDTATLTGPTYGMRRYEFSDITLHNQSALMLKNQGSNAANVRGIFVNGVHSDSGGEVFAGVARQSSFLACHINNSNSPPFDFDGGSEDVLLSGFIYSGHDSVAANRASTAIVFGAGDHARFTIDAKIVRTTGHAIRVEGDDPGTTELRDLTFNIDAREIGTVAGDSYIIRFQNCTLEGRIVIRGSFDQHANNTATHVIEFNNVTNNAEIIVDLAFDSANLTLTDTADNVDVVIAGNAETGVQISDDVELDLFTNRTRAVRIDTSQNVGIGTGTGTVDRKLHVSQTSSVAQRLTRTGSTGGVGLEFENDDGSFAVFGDPTGADAGALIPPAGGGVSFGSSGSPWNDGYFIGAYNTTTASAANMFVSSAGQLQRSTSARKFKRDIEPADPEMSRAIIMGLKPIYYRSRCAADNPEHSMWGLLAEEVAEVDPRLVHWRVTDEGPKCDGVQYERVPVHLITLAQKHERELSEIRSLLEKNVESSTLKSAQDAYEEKEAEAEDWKARAEAAEAKLAELSPPPAPDIQITAAMRIIADEKSEGESDDGAQRRLLAEYDALNPKIGFSATKEETARHTYLQPIAYTRNM